MVAQEVGDLLVGGNESAKRGERLRECAHNEVDILGHAEVVAGSAASAAEDADAVGFVDHHTCIILLCETHDLRQVGHVAFHREDAVGDDKLHLVGIAFLKLLLKRGHVVVFVFELLAERQTATFDNGSMILLVPEDIVLAACQRRHNAEVDAETG